MQFCLRHKISYTAIGDLLKLLLLICPVSNKLPTSFYKFNSEFGAGGVVELVNGELGGE